MRQTLHWIFCTVLTLGLMIACVRYVSSLWVFSFFFSLQLHIGVALLLGSSLLLLVFRSRYGLFLLLASCLVTGHALYMPKEFIADRNQEVPADAPRIRLVSLNVLSSNMDNSDSIRDYILESGADVVFLLESKPMADQLAELEEVYPYRIGCGNLTPTCDLVVLSRHPLVRQDFGTLSDLRQHRYAIIRIEIAGRPVRLAAAHLSKPYFDKYHAGELATIYYNTWTIDGPFVIAGDFNSSSIAPDMQQFLRMRNLRTADTEPATWPAELGRFGIPIDHVYATPDVMIQSVRPVDIAGSNHRGLIADMVLLGD